MPGLVPTKTQIKFGARMSVRGLRCAYFEGGAYLLGLRFCFLGWLDGGVVEVVERERLLDLVVEVEAKAALGMGLVEVRPSCSLNSNLLSWPLNDEAGGGEAGDSGGLDRALLLESS